MTSRGWDYRPGVPAAGHVTPSGYWHPGALSNCGKAPCKQDEPPRRPVDRGYWDRLNQPCPEAEGTRIRLLSMDNDPDPVPVGSTGTVTGGTGAQLWVKWDNGRSLQLLVGIDRYEVIPPERS